MGGRCQWVAGCAVRGNTLTGRAGTCAGNTIIVEDNHAGWTGGHTAEIVVGSSRGTGGTIAGCYAAGSTDNIARLADTKGGINDADVGRAGY